MQNLVRDKKRSSELHQSKVLRATSTVLQASTMESAADVLKDDNVIDVVCGPLEAELRKLKKALAAERAAHKRTQRLYLFACLGICV